MSLSGAVTLRWGPAAGTSPLLCPESRQCRPRAGGPAARSPWCPGGEVAPQHWTGIWTGCPHTYPRTIINQAPSQLGGHGGGRGPLRSHTVSSLLPAPPLSPPKRAAGRRRPVPCCSGPAAMGGSPEALASGHGKGGPKFPGLPQAVAHSDLAHPETPVMGSLTPQARDRGLEAWTLWEPLKGHQLGRNVGRKLAGQGHRVGERRWAARL